MKLYRVAPATALLLSLAHPATTIGQDPRAASPAIRNVQYEVRYDSTHAAARTVAVSMSFEAASDGPVLLSLPAWTPGAYEIRYFARNVSAFAARQGNAPARWEKADHDTWRVFVEGRRPVTVSFTYRAARLDNAEAWSQSDFLFFNGTNLFMYPEDGSPVFPARVRVVAPPDWKVATAMQRAEGRGTFSAASYHDLVDHPFFVGRFDLDSTLVAGKWMYFATYPAGSVTGEGRAVAWDQLTKIARNQAALFQDVPWRSYWVLQIVDSSLTSGSGLEHADSHVDILAPGFVGTASLGSLYAHEIFHAWNVKRIRPAEMFPYRYDRPQPSTLLWISEGVTDYYADLSTVRTGVITEQQFFNVTVSKITEVENAPPSALEDESVSAWIAGEAGGSEIYYSKGSLAALMLDIMIRDATDNRASLDDVMRDLYARTHRQNRGLTLDDWWGAVQRAAGGKSFREFHARYVDGREPYPMAQVLAIAGLKLTETVIRVPRLGVSIESDSAGSQIVEIEPGGPAASAGARVGDYVLTLG